MTLLPCWSRCTSHCRCYPAEQSSCEAAGVWRAATTLPVPRGAGRDGLRWAGHGWEQKGRAGQGGQGWGVQSRAATALQGRVSQGTAGEGRAGEEQGRDGETGQGWAELDRAGEARTGCSGQGKAGQGRSGLAWAWRAGRPRHAKGCPAPQRRPRWPPAHGHPEARACPAPAHLTVYPRSSSLSSYRKDGMNTSMLDPSARRQHRRHPRACHVIPNHVTGRGWSRARPRPSRLLALPGRGGRSLLWNKRCLKQTMLDTDSFWLSQSCSTAAEHTKNGGEEN